MPEVCKKVAIKRNKRIDPIFEQLENEPFKKYRIHPFWKRRCFGCNKMKKFYDSFVERKLYAIDRFSKLNKSVIWEEWKYRLVPMYNELLSSSTNMFAVQHFINMVNHFIRQTPDELGITTTPSSTPSSSLNAVIDIKLSDLLQSKAKFTSRQKVMPTSSDDTNTSASANDQKVRRVVFLDDYVRPPIKATIKSRTALVDFDAIPSDEKMYDHYSGQRGRCVPYRKSFGGRFGDESIVDLAEIFNSCKGFSKSKTIKCLKRRGLPMSCIQGTFLETPQKNKLPQEEPKTKPSNNKRSAMREYENAANGFISQSDHRSMAIQKKHVKSKTRKSDRRRMINLSTIPNPTTQTPEKTIASNLANLTSHDPYVKYYQDVRLWNERRRTLDRKKGRQTKKDCLTLDA